jgi:cyclophilin family peptidyl-prolyl cis-trans isomerase
VAKRRKTKKCPVCKVEIKADRIDSHMKTAHPGNAAPEGIKGPSRPRKIPAVFWPALAVIAVVVVASVGIYYLNQPSPEEDGTDIVNPPPSSQAYPTNYARISTGSGDITVELYGNETPQTVQNFMKVANQSWYSGTIFHRVLKGFMIQGGGFTWDEASRQTQQKPTPYPPIKLEISPKINNWRGTIAMARTNVADSATTQFYINLVDNSQNLGPGGVSPEGYAAFGKVIRGMDVVDRIASDTPVTGPADGEKSQPVNPQDPTLMINAITIMATAAG